MRKGEHNVIITIDGPVGTGKSTVAKKLAESLGYIYFDTGAMYRAVTYGILKHKINIDDVDTLSHFLKHFSFDVKIIRGEKRYIYEGEDITDKIRTREVTAEVSRISANKYIREKLVAIQQHCAVGINAVFEGRDMGSVVFPDANVKVYLTARPSVRAKRRYDEIVAKNPKEAEHLNVDQVLEDITKRDAHDSSRDISPLRQSEDAALIDTSDLTIEEVVFKILEYKDSLKWIKKK